MVDPVIDEFILFFGSITKGGGVDVQGTHNGEKRRERDIGDRVVLQ